MENHPHNHDHKLLPPVYVLISIPAVLLALHRQA